MGWSLNPDLRNDEETIADFDRTTSVTRDMHTAVRDRLTRFRSSGDLRVILEPQAAEEVAALRASIGWPPFGPLPSDAAMRRELDAVVLAGTVQFIRCQELPPVDRVDALLEVMEIFTAVGPLAPDAVPEPMRAMCGALAGNPPEVNHAELHNEAIDMLDAAGVTGDREAVDQAIWLLASAFLAARADADRARHLSVLGTAWLDRYGITGRMADLDNAVATRRQAVAMEVPDLADRAGHQANLSAALVARYETTGNVPDLDQAVTAARAATGIARAAGGQDRPVRPRAPGPDPAPAIRRARQTSQFERSADTAGALDHAAASEAIAASRSAAEIDTAPATIRALAARDWGHVAADIGAAAEAVNGLSAAVNLQRALEESPHLAHFACHGTQDITNPSTGHLCLHDGPLGITEIVRLRLDTAELAYLSACETSVGGVQLSDEAITLATAFQLAGYRHVISTLWAISDTHASQVAREVYQQVKNPATGHINTDGTAAALDTTLLALKNARRTDPWLWASYIHIGP